MRDDWSTLKKLIWWHTVLGAGGGGPKPISTTVTGISPLALVNAVAGTIGPLYRYGWCKHEPAEYLSSVVQEGKVEQNGTPTPDVPVDIVCNNGAVKLADADLPSGYKRLTGIQLNKARYVLTDFYLTGEDTLRFRAKGAASNWIGSFNDADANDNYSFYASTSATSKYARYNGQTGGSSIANATTWYDIEMSPTGVTGTRNPSSFTPSTFTCSVPFCIGATSPTGTSSSNVSFEGDIVVDGRMTLIPCERVSDGAIGYHDGTTFFEPSIESDGSVTSLGYDTSHMTVRVIGTPEVIQAGGLNIFYNDEAWEQGFYLSDGKVASAAVNRTFIMRCTPNTTYYWKHCSMVGGIRAFTVDEDEVAVDVEGTWIKQNPVVCEINEVYSATTGANAKWLCVCFGRNQNGAAPIADQWSDFMLSVSPLTADTPYEPYSTPQTASVQNLFAVGDYADTQNIISGSVTRRVGIKVLDGTEAWREATHNGVFYIGLELGTISQTYPIVSNAYKSSTVANASMPDGTGKVANTIAVGAALHLVNDTYAGSVEDFKSYLAAQYAAGTPVIALYPLAEETTETVEGQVLTKEPVIVSQASISGITLTTATSEFTTPDVNHPLNIVCNNGVVTENGALGPVETVTISADGAEDQMFTVEDLLGVGDYKDMEEVVSGTVTRKCAVCVYDGTQSIGTPYISSTGGLDTGATIVYYTGAETTEQTTPHALTTAEGTNTVTSSVDDAEMSVTYLTTSNNNLVGTATVGSAEVG